jgi:hypothetical protein
MKINCLSANFSHDFGSTAGKKPKNILWEYFTKNNSISVYIDNDVVRAVNEKKDGKLKFLWLLESRQFSNNCNNFVISNLNEVLDTFELIFTHNEELLILDKKFVWVPANGTWIKNFDSELIKTKKTSMILSNKTYTTNQRSRIEFANNNSQKIDLYGIGFNHIKEKEIGLNDYHFSVCFENDIYDTYFTEKILDCFATKTIPIYSGTKKISNHFDRKSIIFLDEISSIDNVNIDFYYENMNSINHNFELSKNYDILDDWIYNNILINYN